MATGEDGEDVPEAKGETYEAIQVVVRYKVVDPAGVQFVTALDGSRSKLPHRTCDPHSDPAQP